MTPHARGESWQLFHGDCREVLASLPDCSVDSVVTDPPYELGFMGKAWDASGIAYNVDLWTECLRVLKPGGHLLAFGGTRTYHRMAVAIEDAGFEIRDSLHWVYGSGFPKSLDVSKAIDKQRHDRADILRVTNWIADAVKRSGVKHGNILRAFGFNEGSRMVGHWTARVWGSQPAVPTLEQVPLLLDTLGVEMDDVPEDIRRLLWDLNGRKGQPGENWWKREVVGTKTYVNGGGTSYELRMGERVEVEAAITAPATDAAKQWEGWGTALKPAHEPIVLARKPLTGTVAATVLEHGTGALNIDGTRVGTDERVNAPASSLDNGTTMDGGAAQTTRAATIATGRWPANVIFDTEAGAVLDEQSGVRTSGIGAIRKTAPRSFGLGGDGAPNVEYGDTGGASRFFTSIEWEPEVDVPFRYVPKPSKKERTCDGTVAGIHPTQKPLALMRWLVRLVTPPGGTVLDPFAGSGTTLMATLHEDKHAIGIELTDEYLPIIEGRVAWALANMPEPSADQLSLME